MSRIAFIGGGNMGYALAIGLKRARPQDVIVVADPVAGQRERFAAAQIETTAVNEDATRDADVVVFAVKPQIIEAVATGLCAALDQKLVISIAAGTPLTRLNEWLGATAAIVRCMPNTPALIGEGITGMLANDQVTPAQRVLAETVLGVCGAVIWFNSDDELDKVTALSGSGPAYFFYLIEALVAAGETLGLSRETALQLVTQTAVGASVMAKQPSSDPTKLRESVTSPGGTTEAALKRIVQDGVDATFVNAVEAAYRRARELAH